MALFLAGLTAAMHFAKLAPVMEAVGHELGLDLVAAGFAVSILGIIGVLFAITAGAIVASIGLGRGMVWALFGGSAIAAAGAFAPNGTLFLASRCLEGFSHLLIVVCGPALMAMHAAPRDRPIVLALWSCFFGTGYAITSLLAPAIVPQWGWRGLMLFHALLMVTAGGLVMLALSRSGHRDERSHLPGLPRIVRAHADVYRSGPPLQLALTFCAYTILYLAVLTFLAKYLLDRQQWSEAATGTFMATVSLVSLLFSLLAGVLVRWGLGLLPGFAAAFGVLALTALALFTTAPGDGALAVLATLMMAAFGLLPGLAFAHVPQVAPTPALAALTYGAIAQFGNVGTFLGTPLFAVFYSLIGWTGGALFIVTTSLTGIALAAMLRRSLAA